MSAIFGSGDGPCLTYVAESCDDLGGLTIGIDLVPNLTDQTGVDRKAEGDSIRCAGGGPRVPTSTPVSPVPDSSVEIGVYGIRIAISCFGLAACEPLLHDLQTRDESAGWIDSGIPRSGHKSPQRVLNFHNEVDQVAGRAVLGCGSWTDPVRPFNS